MSSEMERRIAEMLTNRGYTVSAEPDPSGLPFDLGGYQPDLLAVRGEEALIIEVKGSAQRMPIDRYRDIAEVVSSQPGWRFVLMTSEDVAPPNELHLLSWNDIANRCLDGERLCKAGQPEAGLLLLWTAMEAALRRQAFETGLPAERLPPSMLLKHLYSTGELSMAQFDQANTYLNVRNQVVHGYLVDHEPQACIGLAGLLEELLTDWSEAAE
jgi:hypothetical protein